MKRASLLVLACGVSCTVLAADIATGSGTLDGKSFAARGAFAYRDEGYTMVVVSSANIDVSSMVRDGRVDPFAVIGHQTTTKATVVKLMIDPKGQMACFNVIDEAEGGNRCGDF